MNPTCYADLHLAHNWTAEEDSQGDWGECQITPGNGYVPMMARFSPAVRPQGQSWSNAYILHRNQASNATLWAYVASVRLPSIADVNNCQAFEMDFQKNDGSHIFNLGWQFLFGTGLRIWNRYANNGKGSWQSTQQPVPTALSGALPTRIVCLFQHDTGGVTYLGVSFNGVWVKFNYDFPAVAKAQNKYVNNAVQVDSKGQGAHISLEVHECSLIGF